jgi:hypothetical protein
MSTTIRHPPPLNDPRNGVQKHYISPTPNARVADDNGLNDILGVTQILENHDIPCFCVGISALKFYGAARDRRVSYTVSLFDNLDTDFRSNLIVYQFRLLVDQ